MKRIALFSITIASLLASCGQKAETPTDAAGVRQALQTKRDELQRLQTEIADLEKMLAQLDTTAKTEKTILATTLRVAPRTFEHFVEVQGNVATVEDPAMASSEMGGRILEMLVKEGDVVKKGDLIAKVNLESIQRSIDELGKSMELAQDIYQRQEKLWKQNIGTEIQYLQAKNQVESLQKTKERLETELRKANVFAPASGTVEMVMLKAGEVCGPGTPIVQIVNSNALKVVANVPEVYLPAIRRGDVLRVKFPALLTEQTARVSMIGRTINPSNRTFEVEATVSNDGGLVKPNLLATVLIKDYENKNVAIIPTELIMQDVTGASYVMVNDNGKAAKRPVTLGKNYNNETEILTGLAPNDEILVKGARQAVEGDGLSIVADPAATPTTAAASTK